MFMPNPPFPVGPEMPSPIPMPPHPLLALLNQPGAGLLPPPPMDMNAPPGENLGELPPEDSAIDPTTGQPMGGWNKARSLAGPAAGLVGLLGLIAGKKNLAAGALGFGRAAESGWQADVAKYERQQEREGLEAQDWARKKRDELDQLNLDDPRFAELKRMRMDLTKALAERKLRPNMIKKFQQTLGSQSELIQEAKEGTEIAKAEKVALKRQELELRAEKEKQIQEYVKMGMPREIAEQQLAKDLELKAQSDRKKAQDTLTAPSELDKFNQQIKEHGLSRALQYAQLEEQKQYHRELQEDREVRRKEVQARFEARQAFSDRLSKEKGKRFDRYEADKAFSVALDNADQDVKDGLQSPDDATRRAAVAELAERAYEIAGALDRAPLPVAVESDDLVRAAMARLKAGQGSQQDRALVTAYKAKHYGAQ